VASLPRVSERHAFLPKSQPYQTEKGLLLVNFASHVDQIASVRKASHRQIAKVLVGQTEIDLQRLAQAGCSAVYIMPHESVRIQSPRPGSPIDQFSLIDLGGQLEQAPTITSDEAQEVFAMCCEDNLYPFCD
jgi:hypothetical protein